MLRNFIRAITTMALIFGFLFLSSSYAGGESDSEKAAERENLNQIASNLVNKYKVTGKERFDNFHEQFIVLNYYNLPNIRATEKRLGNDSLDFDNPQALALSNEREEELEQARLEKPKQGFDIPGPEQMEINRRKQDQEKKEFNKFLKRGYYEYFLEKLDSAEATVDVCVNLDWKKLGLYEKSDKGEPFSETLAALKTELDELLALLDKDGHSNHNFNMPNGKFDCEVRMDVNKVVLNEIYQNDKVLSIIHPQLVTATRQFVEFF